MSDKHYTENVNNIMCSIYNSDIIHNIAVLVSGTAAAQLAGVIATPFLSRIYTPSDFGLLGALLAITGVVSAVSTLKFEIAIAVEKNDDNADAIQFLCLIILTVVSLVAALGFYYAPHFISNLSQRPALMRILPVASLVIFCNGLYNVFRFRLNREKKYKTLARAIFVQRLSIVIAQMMLGVISATGLSLIFGNAIGTTCCVAMLIPAVLKETSLRNTKISDLKKIAKYHYRFPAYSAPQNLLNVLSQNMPVYLLGHFFGLDAVGSYFFAMRILQLPSALVGQSVRQVFYTEATSLSNNIGSLLLLHIKTSGILACISIPLTIFVFLLGPDLFATLFGQEWLLAGKFSRWIILWLGIGFVNPPTICILNTLGMQKYFLIYDIFLLMSRVITLYIMGKAGMLIATITAYSLVGAFFNLCLVIGTALYLYKYSRSKAGLRKNPTSF